MSNATLPLELILLIAGEVPLATLFALSRTCHCFHQLLTPLLTANFTRDAPAILKYALQQGDALLFSRAFAVVAYRPPGLFNRLLINALRNRNVEIVEILLEAGAQWSWFHEAVFMRWVSSGDLELEKERRIEKLLTGLGGGVGVRGAIAGTSVERLEDAAGVP